MGGGVVGVSEFMGLCVGNSFADWRLPCLVDDVGDGSPDGDFLILSDFDWLKGWVLSLQDDFAAVLAEALHGELTIDHGHHDLTVSWDDGLVHDQGIASMDPSIAHRLAFHPNEESCCRVPD